MCFRNKNHTSGETVCPECRKNLNNEASAPLLQDLEPDLRALFSQLTTQNKDLTKCWFSQLSHLTIKNRKYSIENVYYNFFK